ncbi:MAG TPA: S8 family serine peptidase, partial [Longimicrobiaceae bacterium]|nr:S8 family serine peptidase [Longimicrobiaceae bacterium]
MSPEFQAPLLASGTDPIPDRYIVVLAEGTPNATAAAAQLVRAHGGELHFTYESTIKGFATTMPSQAMEALRRNPIVSYVVPDGQVQATVTQSNATWGLDRIDQRSLPLSTTYTYERTGSGVTAYVIDTGIRTTHSEFGGRAAVGYDVFQDGQAGQDCHGHGTHVAGTIGGVTYGVAKQAKLVSVRVLSCSGSGTWSGVIAGVDWVTANAVKPAVANISLNGATNAAVNAAVAKSIASGVVYAVAASNQADDACTRSPASAPAAITVGATENDDARA